MVWSILRANPSLVIYEFLIKLPVPNVAPPNCTLPDISVNPLSAVTLPPVGDKAIHVEVVESQVNTSPSLGTGVFTSNKSSKYNWTTPVWPFTETTLPPLDNTSQTAAPWVLSLQIHNISVFLAYLNEPGLYPNFISWLIPGLASPNVTKSPNNSNLSQTVPVGVLPYLHI